MEDMTDVGGCKKKDEDRQKKSKVCYQAKQYTNLLIYWFEITEVCACLWQWVVRGVCLSACQRGWGKGLLAVKLP